MSGTLLGGKSIRVAGPAAGVGVSGCSAAAGHATQSYPPPTAPNTAVAAAGGREANHSVEAWAYVPDTISREAQGILSRVLGDPATLRPRPAPDDVAGWEKVQAGFEAIGKQRSEQAAKEYQITVAPKTMGGIEVVDIQPQDWKDNGQVVVYIHGGTWALFTAQSSVERSGLVAFRTGLRVVSVTYTRPPKAKWPQVTDEIIAVMKELGKEGYPLSKIAIMGDSSGGNLAACVTLKMRDLGIGMPSAVVMWSPCVDFANTADTRYTLRDAEPSFIYELHVKTAMLAYADPRDWKNPYVSPVYADFTKGFPPALIQVGTRETLLSDSVRLFQVIEAAGGSAKLDVYEGMIHVFQPYVAEAPEGKLALAKVKAFLDKHLEK